MTFSVPKSKTFPGFDVAVAAHAHEMRNWRAHMARVEEDKKKIDLDPMLRHVAHPRPGASALVEACVNEAGEADYAVVDDGPTPEQTLPSRKAELLSLVSDAEQRATDAVMPPLGKRRLLDMREHDILTDPEPKPSLIKSAALAIGLTKPKERSPADELFLAERQAQRARVNAIQRAAAQAHHDIEDLTQSTIDAWTVPKFPD